MAEKEKKGKQANERKRREEGVSSLGEPVDYLRHIVLCLDIKGGLGAVLSSPADWYSYLSSFPVWKGAGRETGFGCFRC